jgi:hypothetical protein
MLVQFFELVGPINIKGAIFLQLEELTHIIWAKERIILHFILPYIFWSERIFVVFSGDEAGSCQQPKEKNCESRCKSVHAKRGDQLKERISMNEKEDGDRIHQ